MIPSSLIDIILSYAAEYELLDWVDGSKICYDNLAANPRGLDLLFRKADAMVARGEQFELCWWRMSFNPSAVHLLRANPDKVDWEMLNCNEAAMDLIKAHPDGICWKTFAGNENEEAINMLKAN